MRYVESEKQSISWKGIFIWCVIFWPVGIYLLIKKMTKEKAAALHNSKVLTLIGCVFTGLGLLYTYYIMNGEIQIKEGQSMVSTIIVVLLFFVGGGIVMILVAMNTKKNAIKYKKYIDVVINGEVTCIENIAGAIPTSYDNAVKDLQKMIDMGYFENAFIDAGNHEIVLGHKQSKTYSHTTIYSQSKTYSQSNNYDIDESDESDKKETPQNKVVTCNCCGANNTIVGGNKNECEYCGSPIS